MSDRLRPLISADEIARRVSELGKEISRDYRGREPMLVVGVLNGAFLFLADLLRQIEGDPEVDFLRVSSYGASTQTTGVVQIRKDVEESPTGRHVLLVEDIVDTGLTLSFLLNHLNASQPRSVEVCTLLDKPARRRVDITPRYIGFTIGDEFVVGYGMDYNNRHRSLPGVYVCSPGGPS